MAASIERRAYTIPELARVLGMSKNTLYEEISRCKARGAALSVAGLPVIQAGGRYVVGRGHVARLLGEQPVPEAPTPRPRLRG